MPRDGERQSLGRDLALGSWVQAHFTADTRAPTQGRPSKGPGFNALLLLF